MTDRNEMKAAAELVIGNPAAHSAAELALAGMLLELVEAPVLFFEYDGTARFLRLDGGDPDARIAPAYVVDEGEADAFKRINLRLVELEFVKAQCERWHQQSSVLLPAPIPPAPASPRVSDSYWLDRDNNKHAIGCPGSCGGNCRRAA